ncbi:MAG: CHAT domain-containing protein, partial [Kofleriaceae bacterium]
LMMHADVLDAMGDDGEALRMAAIEASSNTSPAEAANRRRDRAAALAVESRYHEAISELLDARGILEAAKDELGAVRVTAQLAETYEWLGDIVRARDEAAQARRRLDPRLPADGPSMEGILASVVRGHLAGAEDEATILNVWIQLVQLEGRLSRDLGEYERAREAFERAMPRMVTAGKPGIEFQLARIDVHSGDARRGYERMRALEPIFQKGLYAQKLGVLWSWQAEALLQLGRSEEALELARRGADAIEKQNDLDSLWRARWRVARCFLAQGYTKDAYRWALAATTTISSLRRAPLGYRLDSTFLRDKLPVFECAIRLAVELEDPRTVCMLSDAIKSRGLTAVLSSSRAAPPVDPRFDELTTQIDRLDHLANTGVDVEASRTQLLAARAQVIEQIRLRDPRWRAVTEAPNLDLASLQKRLATDDAAALTVYRYEDQLVAALITPVEIVARTHRLAPTTIEAIERYRANCASAKPDVALYDPGLLEGLSATNLVPEPILERALATSNLIAVPHQALHVIPWAALLHRGRRLFEHTSVSVCPNLSSIALLRSRANTSRRVGLIGAPAYPDTIAPLLLASSELSAIRRRYEADGEVIGTVIEGEDATCAAFLDLAVRPDASDGVLHVACHGEFLAGEPMRSSLLFADGRVDAATIARLQIPYDEVVLSACSTGYRPTEVNDVSLSGDDIVGLVAAFMEAGVSTVLVSIPRARDDAAQRFMSAYHLQRAKGISSRAAYRDTQRTMLSEATFAPSLWAGFTLYGG